MAVTVGALIIGFELIFILLIFSLFPMKITAIFVRFFISLKIFVYRCLLSFVGLVFICCFSLIFAYSHSNG